MPHFLFIGPTTCYWITPCFFLSLSSLFLLILLFFYASLVGKSAPWLIVILVCCVQGRGTNFSVFSILWYKLFGNWHLLVHVQTSRHLQFFLALFGTICCTSMRVLLYIHNEKMSLARSNELVIRPLILSTQSYVHFVLAPFHIIAQIFVTEILNT